MHPRFTLYPAEKISLSVRAGLDGLVQFCHETLDGAARYGSNPILNNHIINHSIIWLVIAVAVTETLHLPQLHLYRSAMGGFMYVICRGNFMLYVQQQCRRSVLSRPNTLLFPWILPCKLLYSCHDRNYVNQQNLVDGQVIISDIAEPKYIDG